MPTSWVITYYHVDSDISVIMPLMIIVFTLFCLKMYILSKRNKTNAFNNDYMQYSTKLNKTLRKFLFKGFIVRNSTKDM